ncbi:hypothetical protein BC628DRAFT_1530962 [Trametes gibbosa]|nr:hypothetical protein BC628DRAFT_1530962 [Trametes gibbosa]
MDAPYAFATLVTSDHYLPGALAVVAALKELHSSCTEPEVSFQTVCLITPETVDVSSTKLLRRAFDLVIGVEVIEQEDQAGLQLLGRPDLSHVLTKLHVFRLSQYVKIIFLDADVLPIRPLSHLFTIPHEFAAVPDVGWPDIFNSGVMVLTPGGDKFHELTELLKTKGTWDGGDQGLLNEWRGGDWHRLSFTYNTTPTSAYTYAPAYERFGSEISAIHFIGPNKPWVSITYRPPGTKYGQPSSKTLDPKAPTYNYDSLVDRWFDVYDRHYRSEESHEHANFEFTRYDSAWDSGSSFGAEITRPASLPKHGGALGLDDLRRIAVEGISSYTASAQQPEQPPKVGEYRSMPLEGRVDLMRPPRKLHIPVAEGGLDPSEKHGEDQNSTPKQAFQVLVGDDVPRMETLPTPLPSEVPGAPYHVPLSLPSSGPHTPFHPSQSRQYPSHLQQPPHDSEWQDSDFPEAYFQHTATRPQDGSQAHFRVIGHLRVIGVSGLRRRSIMDRGANSPTIRTNLRLGSRHGRRWMSSVLAWTPLSQSVLITITTTTTTIESQETRKTLLLQNVVTIPPTAMVCARADSKVPLSSPPMSMFVTVTIPPEAITPPEAFTHLGAITHPLTPAIHLLFPSINLVRSIFNPVGTCTRISLSIHPSHPTKTLIHNRTSPHTNTGLNLILLPPPRTPPPASAFPVDTYFPNVWDQAPSQEHDATYQSFPPHLSGPKSETFFNPPPPAEIPEQLLRDGQYDNVIGRGAVSSPGSPPVPPIPDPSKLHAIFPWEEKPRAMPRRVFPVSDSPPPVGKFVEEPRPPKPPPKQPRLASQSHILSPPISLPFNLTYTNAWDTVPSIQQYATKLVRPHHSVRQPLPPVYDEGWRKWDEERERVFQEQQDASSMDGDDEDEGDEDDDAPGQTTRWDSEGSRNRDQPRRSRAGSSASTASVKGKKYRGRGIQTDRIETRSMGVQVDAGAREVASVNQKGESHKPSRGTSIGTSTSTRQWPQLGSGIGLLPPVTMREFKRDPDQMGVATPTATQPSMGVMPFPSSASPTGLRSPQVLGSPRTYSPPKAASPVHIPSPSKLMSPKILSPPKAPSPKGPLSPRATMSPRRLSSAQMPTSRLSGSPRPSSPKPASPVVGLSSTPSPRQSPKLARLISPFSPPLHRTSSTDTAVPSSPSTQGPVETPENTPVLAPRQGGRVWDPARGVDVFKRSSEEVLARFLRSGSFDSDDGHRRPV